MRCITDVEKSIVSLKVDGVDLTKLAQKLHINTDVRKKILFAIVSADVSFVAKCLFLTNFILCQI